MPRFLPDINFWLALTFEAHVHHTAAAAWFDSAPDRSCLFCRHTQQGLLRLATNPSVFGAEALTLDRAWACYDELLADPRVSFSQEPSGVEAAWRQLTSSRSYSHKVWSDTYVAAFAIAAGLSAVSFDRAFSTYPGVEHVLP